MMTTSSPSGLAGVVQALTCPVCSSRLHVTGGVLSCTSRHSFDIAREGYVNLLPGRAKASTADTAEMVAARKEFLAAGPFDPLLHAVAVAARGAVDEDVTGIVLDAGGGTGDYLRAVLEAMPERKGISLDISKLACRVAARSLPDAGVVVADVWKPLPLRDRAAALVLDIFSPRNASEFHRVLARDGALIVVTPTALHLASLVSAVGLITVDPDKQVKLAEKLSGHFKLLSETLVTAELSLTREQALAAAGMGPTGAHATPEELATRASALDEPFLTVLSVNVGVYRPLSRSERSAQPSRNPVRAR
jgi:23S rRNA (guanine745-N1)-methyltransferase